MPTKENSNHNINFFNRNKLILISVILFNTISIWTTYCGFNLMWSEGNYKTIIASAFALAVGLTMIYLTLEIAYVSSEKETINLILSYIVMATISILFNFNFLFNNMIAKELEGENYLSLRMLMTKITSQAKSNIKSYYDIDQIESELNKSIAGMSYEIKRPDIPGKGPIFKEHLRQNEVLKIVYNSKLKKYNEAIKFLEKEELNFPQIVDFDSFEETKKFTERIKSSIKTIIQYAKGSFNSNIQMTGTEKELLETHGKKTDLWFSLYIISNEIKNFLKGDWNRPIFIKFCIALFLSLLIDLSIFIVVVLSNSLKNNQSNKIVVSEDIMQEVWEDNSDLWDKERI